MKVQVRQTVLLRLHLLTICLLAGLTRMRQRDTTSAHGWHYTNQFQYLSSNTTRDSI